MIDSKSATAATDAKWVPIYCYNCVAGPDLLAVKVENGVATDIAPNFAARDLHPGDGRPCVKAYGLMQKTYSPHRILTPMRRTNPKKGMRRGSWIRADKLGRGARLRRGETACAA